MNYHQQIKHPNWQKKRLEVLEIYEYTCMECGVKDQELHVHHPVYKRGAMIWEYEADELRCLCHKCHKDAHAIDERIKKSLSLLNQASKLQVLGYVDSMITPDFEDESPEYAEGYADRFRSNTTVLARLLKNRL